GDDEFNSRMMQYYGAGARGIIEELLYFKRTREDSLTSTIKIGSSPRTTYVDNYKAWHESIKDKKKLYVDYPLKERPFPVDSKIEVPYKNEIHPTNNISALQVAGTVVTASLASIPPRKDVLKKVIDSILPQIDKLNIYLNEYEETPDFLQNEKIKIFRSQDHGDLADNGKFFNIQGLKGFHITLDDDILYPEDYVKTLLKKLKTYHYMVGLGSHGVKIKESFNRYYDISSREVMSFYLRNPRDHYAHIIGTGTLAYHTKYVNFTLDEVDHTRMIDIYFGLHCQKNNIPLICIAHERGWMQELETPKESRIFDRFSTSDDKQTALVKSINWNFKYHPYDIKDQIDQNLSIEERMLRKLDHFGERLIECERNIANQKKTIQKYQNDLAWYSRTYDHLPKWFLKIGSIFRRWPFNKL
ncbi:MAG: hypothetical protein R3345_11880, partial [Fulvivirga sp.]|nr:hypothetical protein [Fulvivirga sp.]